MSVWTLAAVVLLIAFGATGVALARMELASKLVALQLASALVALAALAAAQSFGNESAYDVAFSFALLSFPAGLVFARFYGRWL